MPSVMKCASEDSLWGGWAHRREKKLEPHERVFAKVEFHLPLLDWHVSKARLCEGPEILYIQAIKRACLLELSILLKIGFGRKSLPNF